MRIDEEDVLELAAHICHMDENADPSDIEDKLIEEKGIDLAGFAETVEALLPLIDIGESPLTGNRYKGFSKSIGDQGERFFFVKMKA